MKKPLKSVCGIGLAAMVASLGLLAGCSGEAEPNTEPATDSAVDSAAAENLDTYKVGISQFVQHPALDAATQGFQDALKEKLGDRVTFDVQNANGDPAVCTTIASTFVSNEVDLIMANATPALTAASEVTSDIPIVGTSITDYATALSIADWTGKSGINVTGTADLAPIEDQAKMMKELLPDAEKIGILFCSSEANSKYQADAFKAAMEELGGVEVQEYTFADNTDIINVTQRIVDECDAMYIPTDNTAAESTEAINNVTEPANFPVIAGEEGICKGCGVATLSISYYELGRQTGEMAYEILVNGANPAEMEVQYYANDLTKEFVKERADALGITIPEDYVALALDDAAAEEDAADDTADETPSEEEAA